MGFAFFYSVFPYKFARGLNTYLGWGNPFCYNVLGWPRFENLDGIAPLVSDPLDPECFDPEFGLAPDQGLFDGPCLESGIFS